MNTKKSAFALIYFQKTIRAIGGFSNTTFLDTIETYNLAENIWTTLDIKLLSKQCAHSSVVHNKKFFVIGGVYRVKHFLQFTQVKQISLVLYLR